MKSLPMTASGCWWLRMKPDTIMLLKNILRMAGFDVLSAMDGQEALRKYKDLSPDIVLLDLMMPDMDGWETLRYLREMSDVPVIIISAISAKDDIVRALKTGVDDYLTKPFFNAEVVARIQAVMRRAGKAHPITRLVFPKDPVDHRSDRPGSDLSRHVDPPDPQRIRCAFRSGQTGPGDRGV